MNYHNVISAVVRALAAETINSSGGCNVEPRVQASKLKGEISGKDAALLADCIVHKLLHAQLSPRHWNALVAKYSTHRGRKIDSIGRLVAVVKTPAPQRFTQQSVLVWAVPQQVRGIQRAVTQIKAPKHRENKEEGQWDWRNAAADADVARANKHARAVAEDKPGEMIVLADSNYDMTNWDSQGLTERTYQRWNKAIKDGLESLVNEALVEAQHMLEAVGVLESEAA
ncbi:MULTISPECIES: hypothetical protein [Pseudomonas]|jgi:hypothetical protein|uniref:hypothetical protein n=1 Tax=Pseudomonas TaxID=286 RepID=UPI000C88E1BC|nr:MULTISPECIES: hypothetical protein [Pseudomonas]MBL1311261.1 hypothetical protein [Pseudomonas sp.]PMX19111.1 hypothetical protein C1Y25_00465 [Pseudomonas sp. MPBC4-3]PMX50072.1 hypothetical protein C1Y20_04180 [Pseudomonas sp. FW301-21B01]PMY10788.1 hypothetical protein C1Y18_02010 [Pseudomonas sp. MPR-R5A]PNA72955.1 hypothetical protein C1Y14_01565 [Pseudomonas sp. MPR-R5B]